MALTPREQFLKCARFEGRPLFRRLDHLMPGVVEDWLAEGVPQADIDAQIARCDLSPAILEINTGAYPPFAPTVVEETDEYTIMVNDKGGKSKLQKGFLAQYPMPVEWPIHSAADWERLRPLYRIDRGRLAPGWAERARQAQAQGLPVRLDMDGFYWYPREAMSDERLLVMLYDDPGLVHDINETRCQLTLALADELEREGIVPDCVHWPEDIAFRGGPLISPRHFREFLSPYYCRVAERFRGMGVPHLEVDSDGNVEQLIPLYIEAGVTGMTPFECQAGMDVAQVRARYGRDLIIAGGIDKLVLPRGRQAIDAELAHKLPIMVQTSGYIVTFDHRLIRGVPFADFVYYVGQVRRYLGMED